MNDSEFLEMCRLVAIPDSVVLVEKQADALAEFAKSPRDVLRRLYSIHIRVCNLAYDVEMGMGELIQKLEQERRRQPL